MDREWKHTQRIIDRGMWMVWGMIIAKLIIDFMEVYG